MSREVIISFKDVSKSYDKNLILHNFNLQIEKGDFLTIIGTSGSGKTTALKLINGLLKADTGDVCIEDKNITSVDIISLRRNIGYVIQGVGLFPHMTVRKNIAYVSNLSRKKDKSKIDTTVNNLIKIVGMDKELLDRYPNELSGGQKQRIGIARALAASPKILLMDEPFGAVDEITRKSLQEEILRIHKELGVTIIFITHDIKEALKLGSKVLIMDKGEIIQLGTPDEIKSNPKNSFVKELISSEL
ncbi:ATP-binding cassette domain-containing protein [Clostridium intestinale]|uniref:ABC-type quaternary amine transporter n=1 Tax=Clostridium intestinale URNW TaxID=1294142 RepID=U2NQR7_9CLOT|nr:ABC transporter ATP-binding protein [Clostridium intestinale]ERK31206.1 nitrate/sulfonate/bicarbonate ABC transporter [Clostridium intestinale URNW]